MVFVPLKLTALGQGEGRSIAAATGAIACTSSGSTAKALSFGAFGVTLSTHRNRLED